MFFYLSKIFSIFFLPYTLFLLLLFWISIRLPASFLRIFLRIALVSILILSFWPFSNLLLSSLESQYPSVPIRNIKNADVIVLLSGMIQLPSQNKDRPEFTSSVDRLLLAEYLWKKQPASFLFITGGSPYLRQEGLGEAQILKNWLLKYRNISSLRQKKILAENKSRNTAESAKAFLAFQKKYSWKKIILVTSAYHMPRTLLAFQKQGAKVLYDLQINPFPVDYKAKKYIPWPEGWFFSLLALEASTLAIREYWGLLAYKIKGYI